MQNKSTHVASWTLKGVSPETREAALQAAKDVDMHVGDWVEQVIKDALTEAEPNREQASLQSILSAIRKLDRRVAKIEEHQLPVFDILKKTDKRFHISHFVEDSCHKTKDLVDKTAGRVCSIFNGKYHK